MGIYRGAGGTGDATNDSSSQASAAVIAATNAAASATAASTSANNAANSATLAATYAVNASNNSRLSVGTTTTGAGGTNAIATITGDAGAQLLNLTIPRGVGLPTGGTTSQILSKNSSTDYDFSWISAGSGTVTSVTGTSPISVATGTTTPAISISQSNTTTSGYISSTDWNTFNNKQATLVSGTNIKTVGGNSLVGSGDVGTIGLGYGGSGKTTANESYAAFRGFNSTNTVNGTTTLTATSSHNQLFTGTNSQTITLPVASTLSTGWSVLINNASTGSLTVNSSGNILVITVLPNTSALVTCIAASGTGAGSWEAGLTNLSAASSSQSGYLSSADWSTFNSKGSGTVTSVSGTSPISVATGTTTPAISISQATSSTNGYLSSTDWTTFNNKQPSGNYLTTVSVSSPLGGNGLGATPITISQATTSTSGYLSSTDWNTFNNKGSGTVTSIGLTAGTGVSVSGSPITSSGSITVTNTAPMTYPTGSGIPVVSSGASWGTTLTAPSGTIVGTSDTQTLTNKVITSRASTTTSSATPTINTDNTDIFGLTAQAVDITSFTTNLSGTPTNGQKLWIYIVGTAARAITWGTSFEASTVALPTTTVTTNRLDVGFVWNAATSKWRCVAVA